MRINMKSNNKTVCLRFICGLIILLGIFTYGCEKDDYDEYYIKYTISSDSDDLNGKLNVTINSEHNEYLRQIIMQNSDWEMIIGPVSNGFNSKLELSNKTGSDNLQVITSIQVSKNNSPFAIKAIRNTHGEAGSVVSSYLDYTIDY